MNFEFKMASLGNVVFIDRRIMDVAFLISLIRTFQETSTNLHGSYANSNPIPTTPGKLASIAHDLLSASLQKSSVPTYRRAWKLYEEFQISVLQSSHVSLPVLPATLALFVAYLFDLDWFFLGIMTLLAMESLLCF